MTANSPLASPLRVKYHSTFFGRTRSGVKIGKHSIRNLAGFEVSAIDFGAIITGLKTPDRTGKFGNIVLNAHSIEEYERCPFYVGAVIGRYAGRIRDGRVAIGDKFFELEKNDRGHCLHGGVGGFDKKVWGLNEELSDAQRLCFFAHSKSGDGGFPGDLELSVVYELNDENELVIAYGAKSTAPTVVNLTQHSYFNLSGVAAQSVSDHVFSTTADQMVVVDAEYVPTGEIAPIDAGFFPNDGVTPLGDAVKWLDHDLLPAGAPFAMRPHCTLYHPTTGRRMTVFSDQPALHVYAGKNLEQRYGRGYLPNAGICFETQAPSNSPNIEGFPDTIILPGEVYRRRTVIKFDVV